MILPFNNKLTCTNPFGISDLQLKTYIDHIESISDSAMIQADEVIEKRAAGDEHQILRLSHWKEAQHELQLISKLTFKGNMVITSNRIRVKGPSTNAEWYPVQSLSDLKQAFRQLHYAPEDKPILSLSKLLNKKKGTG